MIVEDGSIVADANSYITVAFADDYHEKRGNTTWATMTVGEKEASIIRATDYIEQAYNQRWKGRVVDPLQSLDFPRAFVNLSDVSGFSNAQYDFIGGVYFLPNNVIPKELKNASAEMAFKAARGELSPDLEPTGNVIAESVDGAVSVSYSDRNTPRFKVFRAIDNMLSHLLKSNGTNFNVGRV
jgi:hypothetical protein